MASYIWNSDWIHPNVNIRSMYREGGSQNRGCTETRALELEKSAKQWAY